MRRRFERLMRQHERGRGLAREGRHRLELLALGAVFRKLGRHRLDPLAGCPEAEHVVAATERLGLAAAHEDVEKAVVGADVLRLHRGVERVDEGLGFAQDPFLVRVAVRQQQHARTDDQRRQVGHEAARHDDRGDDVAIVQRGLRAGARHGHEVDALPASRRTPPKSEPAVTDAHDVGDRSLVFTNATRGGSPGDRDPADEQREHERVGARARR